MASQSMQEVNNIILFSSASSSSLVSSSIHNSHKHAATSIPPAVPALLMTSTKRKNKLVYPHYILTLRPMLQKASNGRVLGILDDWVDFELSDSVAIIV